jgi:uncharacterized protein (TIRG00374 family)
VAIGLLAGGIMLFAVLRVVDIPATMRVLEHNLATPRGVVCAFLSGVAFLVAFSIRGVRWRLFLNPISRVSVLTTIRLFLISITINFLLPIRGGEVVKSLILKRIAAIPISRSLPTVAMDKSFDLLPALFIMAVAPVIGLRMDIKLWLVLGTVSGLLIGLAAFVALSLLKPTAAIAALRGTTRILPQGLGGRVEAAATGLVESLLSMASRPQVFLPAVALTGAAVICDSLFAMLAFWTVGFPISFGTALFGYTVYNMFYVIPTPPGQVGSNEAVGLLVFAGLLHLPAAQVLAMFVFSHSWAAVLMCTTGPICLKTFNLTMPGVMRARSQLAGEIDAPAEPGATVEALSPSS